MTKPVGWLQDDLELAFSVFQKSSPDVTACLEAQAFFEQNFNFGTPVETHFTGYFETVLQASLEKSDAYQVPLYGMPNTPPPYPSRAKIAEHGLDAPVLAWCKDPLDAFLLQVQGSGRLVFPDGRNMGIGYASKNGHPYHSIGAELVKRGVASAQTMSLDVIRDYCTEHLGQVQDLLNRNPSYVFFTLRAADTGPIGAMGMTVTPFRSLAVDPDHIPLGSPVWVELMLDDQPIRSLMIAQDIGSAIKGAARADIFCGTGEKAGARAGRLNQTGKMIPLVPRQG